MLFKFVMGILVLISLSSAQVGAQTLLKGNVADDEGVLSGVSVKILETGRGVLTDQEGNYFIQIPQQRPLHLRFSFTGKESRTVKYNEQKTMNIKLKNKSGELKEVVVRARPNINAIDIRSRTGSVANVDMDHVKNKPVASLGLALQGAVAGLQVINRGELGEKPEIRIRGNSSFRRGDLPNEPLYILDGQEISSETFFTLNPEDIRDIKVLKDAVASALYGIKGANGVLEITSTRGFAGQRVVTYSAKTGITFRGQQTVPMMDSREKLELERLLGNSATPGYRFSEEYIRQSNLNATDVELLVKRGAEIIDSLSGINTDWYRKLLHTNIYQSHNLSIRGGSNQTSYYTSFGIMQQGGQIPGNDYTRFSGRVSIDQQLSEKAVTSLSINGSYARTNTPNGSNYSVADLVYQLNPYETESGEELVSFPGRSYFDLFNQFRKLATDKNAGISLSLNYHILKGLELSAVGGLDFLLSEELKVTPPSSFSEMTNGTPVEERGKLSQAKNTSTKTSYNVRLTYNRQFGKHDVTLGANTDYSSTLLDNIWVSGSGVYGNAMSAAAIDNNITGNNQARVGAQKELVRNIGAGVVTGYSFDNTYDFFATLKIDGSSVLPKNKRLNRAWALGVGWDIKKYPGLKTVSWLSAFKLRASYGYTANLQGVSPENISAIFQYQPESYARIRMMRLMALANADLQAEQNIVFDYGFNATVYNTNINVSFYRRTTRQALVEMPIAASNGFLKQIRNIGVLENSGIELNLSQQLLQTANWTSRLNFIFSYNRNRVVSLYGGIQRLYTSAESVIPNYEVGKPLDHVYGTNSLGINPITGVPVFLTGKGEEVNPEYELAREDLIFLGHSNPPMSGSFMYSLQYKNLEVNMDFYYTLGGVRPYAYTYVRDFSKAHHNAIRNQVANMWFKSGDENKLYRSPYVFSSGLVSLQMPSNRAIGSTDMIRLNSVLLRYRFSPEKLQKVLKIVRNANAGIQAANLFTLKSYSESDPESGQVVAPLQPVVTAFVNISF